MREFSCRCGQVVYFENNSCGNCSRQLAFDPVALTMAAEETAGSGLSFCMNRSSASECNWLADTSFGDSPCLSCQTNRTIPNLSRQKSRNRWRKLDSAKRRMLADVLGLGLPVDPTRLRFDFKEDKRINPDAIEEFVSTGHLSGVITINAAEADPVFRESMRKHMNEAYRTLLGHLRHESGHYFYDIVVGESLIDEARSLFGDERQDYAAALQRHYRTGASAAWQGNFISHYASSHPMEDWAECWGHYLHVRAVLDVASAKGFISDVGPENWLSKFVEFSVSLNEVTRSLGLPDAYPFIQTDPVTAKIKFVHKAIQQYQSSQSPHNKTPQEFVTER